MAYTELHKTLKFTERMIQMVEEIKEDQGLPTFTSVIYVAVAQLYKQVVLTNSYRQKGEKKDRTPEDKERDLAGRKKARAQMQIEEQERICGLLGGKTEDDGGTMVCTFYNYINKKRYPQKVALIQLSEDLVRNQYQPSREKVERLQKENLVDY